MKTKTRTDKKMIDKMNSLATHNQCRIRIAQDKERARCWAEERRLKRNPLVVAKAAARVPNNNARVNSFQVSQLSPEIVLRDLKRRK